MATLLKTRQHWAMFIRGWRSPSLAIALIIASKYPPALVTLLALILMMEFPAWVATEYEVTDKELILRTGLFLPMREFRLRRSKIQSVSMGTTTSGKVFGYGVVDICGLGGSKFRIHYVPDAQKWLQELQQN